MKAERLDAESGRRGDAERKTTIAVSPCLHVALYPSAFILVLPALFKIPIQFCNLMSES